MPLLVFNLYGAHFRTNTLTDVDSEWSFYNKIFILKPRTDLFGERRPYSLKDS